MRPKASIGIPPLQAVTFDLDDTLYPEREYVKSGHHAVAEYLRHRLATAEPYEDSLCEFFLAARAGRAVRAFQSLSERFGLGLSEDGVAELVKVYREHRPTIQPFPWVPPLLERLRQRVRLGLLTDGYLPGQRLKLEALGLESLFDAVVFTEELGREAWKPSQVGFLQLARELGLGKRAHRRPPIAYVGDNPAKDFVAPNELGWVTIQYLHPGAVHAGGPCAPNGKPQIAVKSPEELALILLRD